MSLNVLASILSERLFHTWKDSKKANQRQCWCCFAVESFQPEGQFCCVEDQHGPCSSDCGRHWLDIGGSFRSHCEKGAPPLKLAGLVVWVLRNKFGENQMGYAKKRLRAGDMQMKNGFALLRFNAFESLECMENICTDKPYKPYEETRWHKMRPWNATTESLFGVKCDKGLGVPGKCWTMCMWSFWWSGLGCKAMLSPKMPEAMRAYHSFAQFVAPFAGDFVIAPFLCDRFADYEAKYSGISALYRIISQNRTAKHDFVYSMVFEDIWSATLVRLWVKDHGVWDDVDHCDLPTGPRAMATFDVHLMFSKPYFSPGLVFKRYAPCLQVVTFRSLDSWHGHVPRPWPPSFCKNNYVFFSKLVAQKCVKSHIIFEVQLWCENGPIFDAGAHRLHVLRALQDRRGLRGRAQVPREGRGALRGGRIELETACDETSVLQ